MSALPLMRRTALMAVALAVLATAGVLNAQTSQSARTQRKLGAAATLHAAHRSFHSAGRSAGRTAAPQKTYSNIHANLTATRRKLTPDEVGREAGLAILRERAGAQVPRRRMVRTVRRHSTRRVRLERASWRSEETRATRIDESSDAADSYSAPEAGQAETDEAQGRESRHTGTEREAMPATSPTETEDSVDGGTVPVERMMPRSEAAAEDSAASTDTELTGESASSAGTKAKGDVASLVIPRSGMPGPLRGSLASLERQNDRLEAEGLERIEDEADLAARIADKLLVPIPISSALTVNPDLEENHRYCRPWTAKFLADLARAHEAAFHRSIEVSSAVRTVEYQKRLERTNGNAAPAEGDLVSPHLTGATIDIAKKGLTRAEVAWMRRQLMGLETLGKIDVEEEFKQACFHITVYKGYAPAGPATPAKPVAHRSRKPMAEQTVEAQGA
ncbi:MAG: DUF5715 family protein [Terracidiphilus sp.]